MELRDRELLGPETMRALEASGARLCLSVHARMPPVQVQAAAATSLGRGPLVVRWNLHAGFAYEEAKSRYAPFDRLVDEDPATRVAIAALCRECAARGDDAWVIANNKAEGSAPLTLERLARAIVEGGSLEEAELAALRGRTEPLARERRRAAGPSPSRAARDVEAAANEVREEPLAGHARAEARVVVPAAAHLVQARHDVRGLERDVRARARPGRCPSPPRAAARSVQLAQDAPAAGRGLEDRLELVVREEGDDRRDVHADGNARRRRACGWPRGGAPARSPAAPCGWKAGHRAS